MHRRKNRGNKNTWVSGDRVRDLKARWQSDVLDLKPDCSESPANLQPTWALDEKI